MTDYTKLCENLWSFQSAEYSKLRWNGQEWEIYMGYPIGHVSLNAELERLKSEIERLEAENASLQAESAEKDKHIAELEAESRRIRDTLESTVQREVSVSERANKLLAENDEFKRSVAFLNNDVIPNFLAENARLQAERDAAMKDLLKVSVCGTCVHYAPHSKGKCSKHPYKWVESNFAGCSNWQWRGIREGEK